VDLKLGALHNFIREVVRAAEGKAGGLYEESQKRRQALLGALRRSDLGVDEDPLAVNVYAEELVEHDFETGYALFTFFFVSMKMLTYERFSHSAVKVPVVFRVRNLSPYTDASFTLELNSTRSPSPLLAPTPWIGRLTHSGVLPPLQVADFQASVWVTEPGAFDIGRWTLASHVSIKYGEEHYIQVTPAAAEEMDSIAGMAQQM
jgi:hypothetical protein